MNIRDLIRRLGVPFDVTIHDYHVICPRFDTAASTRRPLCEEPGPAACNACIAARPAWGALEILSWRRRLNWLCLDADRVICPSQMRSTVWRGTGWRGTRSSRRMRRGRKRPGQSGFPPRARATAGRDPWHARRGGRWLWQLSPNRRPPWRSPDWRSRGRLPRRGAGFPRYRRRLRNGAPGLLTAKAHVLWFPIPWPQNYSHTLTAAIADSGLPIITTDIGSFPERLRGTALDLVGVTRCLAGRLARGIRRGQERARDATPAASANAAPCRHRFL